ncbi:uncharacterized protein MELLADRAFT_78645 [Melampsora larici-populina 98AG31]|uniref:Uncharacterized protein n=1 Tax=Melampsora larici-populina (strain 98AG31 / pathotype 3-4-7) TaxID=747676 RepID=F4RWT1_MELLP|nr:uncharacterized protein MELLADRAFT_78645 [Melampsora larici-populina 98AG31]EGG03172.1 hypothetical protein MELLADRAFT_78645 [Melampsora larici-populina 98AG31]
MASNSTDPNATGNNNSRSGGGLGAATYYGAVAVVVFVLVALTIVSRVLYTRKGKRLAAQQSAGQSSRDAEERVAMERRGEAVGLPTYRESVLPTSRNLILASTPIASSPAPPRSASVDTLPIPTLPNITVLRASLSEPQLSPPAYRIPPPKYEDAAEDADRTTQIVGQALDAEDPSLLNVMSQRHDSVATLVLPNVQVVDADESASCGQLSQTQPSCQPDPATQ